LACSGPAKNDKPEPKMTQPVVSTSDTSATDVNGVFLHLDLALKAWNQYFLTAAVPAEAHRAEKLEEDIRFNATRYQVDLIEALESGPPFRRQIAALALGFSEVRSLPSDARDPGRAHRVSPVVPLLAALNDPVPEVVSNALLGLGLQAYRDMPTARIVDLLATSPQSTLRINASWALKKLADAGAPLEGVGPVVQRALADEEPAVRAQAALIVARLEDAEAIPALSLLLRDEKNLPAAAAVRALSFMASRNDDLKGTCVRALTAAMGEVRPEIRAAIMSNLTNLSGRNYGERADEEWKRWAESLR